MEKQTVKFSGQWLLIAALLIAFQIITSLSFGQVSAAQLNGRSATLSNSAISATGVQYAFTFTMPTAAKSLIIDFCSNSPVVGQACSAPTGFTAASTTYVAGSGATSPGAGTALPTAFVLGTAGNAPTATTVRLGGATTATTAGTSYSFTLNNITNPSTLGSFYARVYTYTDATYGSTGTAYSGPTTVGTIADSGGIALSTANTVTITATVQETLTFCVFKTAPSANCGGTPPAPNLVLGHGSPQILTNTQTDTDTAYMQLSTNANGGATVNARATNTCSNGGLSNNGGSTCPIAGAGATATAIAAGSGLVGFNIGSGSGGTGAAVTPDAPYNTANYALDTTTSGNNLLSTYGDGVAASTGPTSNMNSLITFAASAAANTPAGIFTGGYSLIATGTF